MKNKQANILIDSIIENVQTHGLDASNLVDALKELRELSRSEEDPLVTKVLRLTYEYLIENDAFDVEAQYEEDDQGNEYPIDVEDADNLIYLLTLLKNAEHRINRSEIEDYRTALKEILY